VSPRPLNNIDGVRMSASLTYLSQARHRLNITIKGSVTVHRILLQGNRAVGVRAESGGEIFNVEGEQIILNGGAIGSPQVLLLSGIGPSDHLLDMGIDVVHELPGVGENLRDHPATYMLFKGYGEPPDVEAPTIQVGLRMSMTDSPTRADFQITPTLMNSGHRPASIQYDGMENHFGLSVGLQNATSAGRLRLTSNDPNVQPNLNYDFFSSPYDRERMRGALREARRISEYPAINGLISERINPTDEDFATDDALDNWMLRNVYTQHHISGTCKMGPASDPMALVDQFCHVHGIEGLRVVDASVMPDVIAPTPTLPPS